MAQQYFAVVTPGLEQVLLEELKALGVKKPEVEHGGVLFKVARKRLYQVLLKTKVANRLYLRLDEFRARDVFELYKKTKRLEWSQWLLPGCQVTVDATVSRSGLQGSGQVQDRVFDGIRDSLQEAHIGVHRAAQWEECGQGHVRVIVRLVEDRCQISLDVAGGRLYRRGWREQTGVAPLRESLASALLMRLGWRPGQTLIDPMCGSGTFLIEAARWQQGLSPRVWPRYGVASLASFDEALWAEAEAEAGAVDAVDGVRLLGCDQEMQVLAVAQGNAQRAQVPSSVRFHAAPVSELSPPKGMAPGLVICNPPYGLRIPRAKGEGAPEQQLLSVFAQRFAGWRLGLWVPADFTIAHEGLNIEELERFSHGGVAMRLWSAQVKI